jgi:very-short-patch-repair endonuclease|tara:strand:+ start:30496 stop:30852 length:357 start_codon:yes stop_codon:yes gene_type:complete
MARTFRNTVLQARKLRKTMSKPEIMLWQQLRKKPCGVKFRRQHPLGPYILDFYCPAAKLAIEVDGVAHAMGNRPERDALRDAFVMKQGIETKRVSARSVLDDTIGIADQIVRYARGRV